MRAANPDPLAQIANEPLARNQIIIAGALDSSNQSLTGFSNRAGNGAQHYLAALGSRIVAIDETGSQVRVSGTSFSAPIISGAVALLAQAFPTLSGAQIVDLLLRSAIDLGAPGTDTIFGRGAIDIGRAFAPQGQLSLAGSNLAVAPDGGGTASPAMGDAAQTGLSTVVIDGYGRAYSAGVGTLRGAAASPKLASALALNGRNLGAGLPGMALSLAVGPGHDRPVVERQLLSPHDQAQSRALAGNVISSLGKDTRLALGVSQSGESLTRALAGDGAPAFLVSTAGSESIGFDRRGQASAAVAQRLGEFSLIAHAGNGDARIWQSNSGWQHYRTQSAGVSLARNWRGVTMRLGIDRLSETETVLGGRFNALFGAGGSASWMAGYEGSWSFAPEWRVGMAWREGWTNVAAGGARLGTDRLRSRAWSFDLERARLFGTADRLAFRVAQPLRVTSGGFDLTLPDAYDYAAGVTSIATRRFNLAPEGREIDTEAAYATPIGRGWLSANLYWRQDPGHIATAPDDVGAAIRFTAGF